MTRFAVGSDDLGGIYVEETDASLGETPFDDEREAVAHGLTCALDRRDAIRGSVNALRRRLAAIDRRRR